MLWLGLGTTPLCQGRKEGHVDWFDTFKCQCAVTGRAIFPPAARPSSPPDVTGQVLNLQSERDIKKFRRNGNMVRGLHRCEHISGVQKH